MKETNLPHQRHPYNIGLQDPLVCQGFSPSYSQRTIFIVIEGIYQNHDKNLGIHRIGEWFLKYFKKNNKCKLLRTKQIMKQSIPRFLMSDLLRHTDHLSSQQDRLCHLPAHLDMLLPTFKKILLLKMYPTKD